jgi:hypothetical protein
MKIQHVDVNYTNQIWPQVEKFIEAALVHQDDYTLEHAKVFVTNGTWTLVVAIDDDQIIHGAATVMFYNRPNDRVAFVITMGGRLITGQETYVQFSDLLKVFGATYIECASRESATRLWERFGLKEKYRVAGARLTA